MTPIDEFFETDDRTHTRSATRSKLRKQKRRRNTIMVIIACALVAGITGGVVFAISRSGSGPEVPGVRGLTYDEAEKEVESAGLYIEIDPNQDIRDIEELGDIQVAEQTPKEGSPAEEGTLVTVRLKGVQDYKEEDDNSNGDDATTGDDGAVKPAKTVCLDPGHSTGSPANEIDPATGLDVADNGGAAGEIQAMWDLAVRIKGQLEQMGYTVLLTKPSADSYASLRTRADIGNTCDIMVRLHYDFNLHAILYPGVGQHKSRGEHAVTVDPQVAQWSAELAQAMLPHLEPVGVTKTMNDCGGTSNNTGPAFVGSVLSTVPVVLIEYNPSTVRDNPAGQDQVAAATAKGIDAYFRSR